MDDKAIRAVGPSIALCSGAVWVWAALLLQPLLGPSGTVSHCLVVIPVPYSLHRPPACHQTTQSNQHTNHFYATTIYPYSYLGEFDIPSSTSTPQP